MPIVIKVPGSNVTEDYAIIELQGDLKSHAELAFEGQFIGDIHFSKNGAPILIIGHHLMFGKEMELDKPFALLEKTTSEQDTEYIVRSIVKKKLIFKTRPKPIVG